MILHFSSLISRYLIFPALSADFSLQSMVLLKNDSTLPLKVASRTSRLSSRWWTRPRVCGYGVDGIGLPPRASNWETMASRARSKLWSCVFCRTAQSMEWVRVQST